MVASSYENSIRKEVLKVLAYLNMIRGWWLDTSRLGEMYTLLICRVTNLSHLVMHILINPRLTCKRRRGGFRCVRVLVRICRTGG